MSEPSNRKNMSIGFKIVIPTCVGLVLLILCALIVSTRLVISKTKEMALNKVKSDLSSTYDLVEYKYPGPWRVDGDKLYKGELLINGNDEIVDYISKVTQGNAVSIYKGNVRVASTLLDENNKRIVGTIAPDEVTLNVINYKYDFYDTVVILGQKYQGAYRPILDEEGNVIGIFSMAVSQKSVMELVNDFVLYSSLISSIFLILILFVLILIIKKYVVNPIKIVSKSAVDMRKGDFDIDIPVSITKHSDEVGILSTTFIELAQKIKDVIYNIHVSSDKVKYDAKLLSDSSNSLADGVNKQASAIEELNLSINELANEARKNAQNAQNCQRLSDSSQKKAEEGRHFMQQLLEAMEGINHAAQRITQFTRIIEETAFETNLLAVNAAVEAKRVGKYGSGFAVVAERIKKLSDNTSRQAKETSEILEGMFEKCKTGSEISKKTADNFFEISESINKLSKMVGQISEYIAKQSVSLSQISSNVDVLNSVVQLNQSAGNETAHASGELLNQAEHLKEIVLKFSAFESPQDGQEDDEPKEGFLDFDNDNIEIINL